MSGRTVTIASLLWLLASLMALLVVSLTAPKPAHAYLDPGTGSAVIQMVVAGVMGALFVLKTYWRKLAAFFGGGDAEPPAAGEARDEARSVVEASATRDERD